MWMLRWRGKQGALTEHCGAVDLEDHVLTGRGADRFVESTLRDDEQRGGRVPGVEDVFAAVVAPDPTPTGQRLHHRRGELTE
jgi:hypothetical protein